MKIEAFYQKACSCGRGLPLLGKVEGRIRENFKNKFGEHINGGVFIDLFYFENKVKQFQIIQEEVDYIIINLVLTEKKKIQNTNQYFKKINQKICKIMGHALKIEYKIVAEINPSPSGKFLYYFSKVAD